MELVSLIFINTPIYIVSMADKEKVVWQVQQGVDKPSTNERDHVWRQ